MKKARERALSFSRTNDTHVSVNGSQWMSLPRHYGLTVRKFTSLQLRKVEWVTGGRIIPGRNVCVFTFRGETPANITWWWACPVGKPFSRWPTERWLVRKVPSFTLAIGIWFSPVEYYTSGWSILNCSKTVQTGSKKTISHRIFYRPKYSIASSSPCQTILRKSLETVGSWETGR